MRHIWILLLFTHAGLFSPLKRNFNVLIFPVIRRQIPLNSHHLMALSLKLDKIYTNSNNNHWQIFYAVVDNFKGFFNSLCTLYCYCTSWPLLLWLLFPFFRFQTIWLQVTKLGLEFNAARRGEVGASLWYFWIIGWELAWEMWDRMTLSFPGHEWDGTGSDQSEASIQITWPVSTNQRPVLAGVSDDITNWHLHLTLRGPSSSGQGGLCIF